MLRLFILIILFIINSNCYSQQSVTPCDILSHKDTLELEEYFQILKQRLEINDLNKLASLCHFPFLIYNKNGDDRIVAPPLDRKEFLSGGYRWLFDQTLKKALIDNNNSKMKLFSVGSCKFPEVYLTYSMTPTSQKILVIRKISGKYKIVEMHVGN